MKKKKEANVTIDKEIKEYPIIYSYIYERESEDIKRLLSHNKPKARKKKSNEVKVVVGFRIEDGKAIPVFEE